MASGGAAFMLAVLNYDQTATVAQRARMMVLQARPPLAPPSPMPVFLPGFLDFVPRLGAHTELLPYDHVAGKFVDPIITPLWATDMATGNWYCLAQ